MRIYVYFNPRELIPLSLQAVKIESLEVDLDPVIQLSESMALPLD